MMRHSLFSVRTVLLYHCVIMSVQIVLSFLQRLSCLTLNGYCMLRCIYNMKLTNDTRPEKLALVRILILRVGEIRLEYIPSNHTHRAVEIGRSFTNCLIYLNLV